MRKDAQKQQTNLPKPQIATEIQTKVMIPLNSSTATTSSYADTAHLYSTNFRENYNFLGVNSQMNALHSQIISLSQFNETVPGLKVEQGGNFYQRESQPEQQKQFISGKRPKNTTDVSSLHALSSSRKQQYVPDMKDLMDNYKKKNDQVVWSQINGDQILNQPQKDFSQERKNNFMSDPERRKYENLDKATRTHFFDGQSKYIPLKLASNREPKPEEIVIIKNWFRALSVEEKTVALTIVDKDLFELFKAMYRVEYEQGQGGGEFCPLVEECRELYEPYDLVEMTQNFKNKLIYQKYSVNRAIKSQALRQKEEAINQLVENIRLVQIRRPNTKQIEYSISVDVELVQSFDYFMKIMKLIDEEFLMREYKITKQTSIVGSLLYSKDEESKARQQPFFHVSDPQKPIYAGSIGTSSGINQLVLENRRRNLESNKISLAKCLLLSFEKGINLHFLDYQKKLAQNQYQQYFLKEQEIDNNIFAQDAKLAKFWFDLSQSEKSRLLDHTKELERLVVHEHNNLKSKRCDIVNETDEEDETVLYFRNLKLQVKGEMKEDPLYLKARRKRKDRLRTDGGSNRTSSSGMMSGGQPTSYLDYSSKQLMGQYGNDDCEDDSFFDYESQRPVVKVHVPVREELFSSENVDNCIFKARQRITTQGMQVSDMLTAVFFIKTLSLSKSLEVILRESAQGEVCMKSIRDMESALLKLFYEYLEQEFQNKINEELFDGQEPKEVLPKKKNKNKKKNKKKAQVFVETAKTELQVVDKKQQVKTKQESVGIRDKALDVSQPIELPKIHISFNVSPKHDKTNDSFVSSSDDYDRQIKRKIKEASEVQMKQILQLNDMAYQIEHINTAEDILDQGGVMTDGAGCDFLERLLLDRIQDADLLQQSPSHFHQALQATRRYEEERTGLLSNKVHSDKYANEVELSVERERQKLRDQVMYSLNQEQHSFQKYGSSDSDSEETNLLKQKINSLEDDIEQEPILQSKPYVAPEEQVQKVFQPLTQLKPKKKNRKKNKKSKGQHAPVQGQISNKQTNASQVIGQTDAPSRVAEILDADVDEIQQVEAKPEQKPSLTVRKQNFICENASQSSSNYSSKSSSHIIYINDTDQAEGRQVYKTEEISKRMTERILGKAVKDVCSLPPKKETKKNKKKAQQELANSKIEEPTLSLLCQSQPQQSVALGVLKEQKPVSNFELDLSDKVKIPGRGKSIISSGKEELQHEQTLQELDSLFRSSDRELNSSQSGKLRSNTVEKSRKASGGNKHNEEIKQSVQISQFNLLDDLEDDVISHKMPNVRRNVDDLVDVKPYIVEESRQIVEKAIENVPSIKPMKKQNNADKRSQVQAEAGQQTGLPQVKQREPTGEDKKNPNRTKEPLIKQDHCLSQSETKSLKTSPEKIQDFRLKTEIQTQAQLLQIKQPNTNQGPTQFKPDSRVNQQQYQQKKQPYQQSKQQQNVPKSQQQPSKQVQSTVQTTQRGGSSKQNQSQSKVNQLKVQEPIVKANSQVLQSQPTEQTTTGSITQKPGPQLPFDSWGSMFQTVYGGGVSAPTNQQAKKANSTPTILQPTAPATLEVQKVEEQTEIPLEKVQEQESVSKSISHEVQSPGLSSQQAKLNKKQRQKQQMLAEQGIIATPLRLQAQTLKVVNPEQLQSSSLTQNKDHVTSRYKQKSLQEQYVNSSFQTTQVETYSTQVTEGVKFGSGMIQERGVATHIQQNNLHTQQIANNFTYNFFPQSNYPMTQTQSSMPFQQYQMQMPQPGQTYQKQPYGQQSANMYKFPGQAHLPNQQHVIPHMSYPYQSQQVNYPNQYLLESFFKLEPLSDQAHPYFQQQEDRFHFQVGHQLTQLQREIDNRLQDSEQARAFCLDLICKIARDTFPELSLSFDVYGSMATKLAIETSDMDIAIYGIQPEARTQALQTLHQKLKEFVSVKQNTLIATAFVPIIKLELNFEGLSEDLKIAPLKIGKITSIKIDIVLNSQDGNEAHQTKRCAEFVKKQTLQHPFLKPITLALKKYLTLKNLNSPFQGTMSSYGIVLLVLALLKDIARQQGPNFENPMVNHQNVFPINLGQAFTHFFFVFGNENLFNEGVIIDDKLEFALAPQGSIYSSVAPALHIKDPIDHSNNVGKQIYNFFSSVQEQFTVTSQVIMQRFKEVQQKMCDLDNNYNELQYYSHQQPKNYKQNLEHQSVVQQRINEIRSEIQSAQGHQLDRIIMVSLHEDLNPIVRDEVEERQWSILQSSKSLQKLLLPLDGRSLKNFQNTNLFFHPHNLGIMPGMQHNDSMGPIQQQQQQPYQK